MLTEDSIKMNAHVQAIIKQYESLILEADRLFQDYVQTNSLKINCEEFRLCLKAHYKMPLC